MNQQFEAYTTAKVGEQYPTHWEPLEGLEGPDMPMTPVWTCGHKHRTFSAAEECCKREYRRMNDVQWISVRRFGEPLWDL
jgi:hypothetical protein